MLDIILETLIDGVKLLPFLFFAFLIIEIIEHRLKNKNKNVISGSGNFGPLFGAVLGVIPQCGFSVMATNLYITRIISLGTLISIYLSTSDEMLPILLSEHASIGLIINILVIKVIIGIVCGFIIDFVIRKNKKFNFDINYDICEDEHCHCEKSILESVVKHTIHIFIFIILISFILNLLLEYAGQDFLSHIFLKENVFSPFISSLVGLIPNCGASVMLTELYLNNAISFGAMIAGLLTGSGVALLVLIRSNKSVKENIIILGLLYGIGAISGVVIEIIGLLF